MTIDDGPSRRPLRSACACLVLIAGLLMTGLPLASASSGSTLACVQGELPASSFTDVGGNAHRTGIDCMSWYGVTEGVTRDRFDPDALVRRDQAATFLVRALAALRVPLRAPGDRFDDVSGVHAENVERLAAAGVLNGTGPREYSPGANLTRGQMASLLRRTYDAASTAFPAVSPGTRDYFADDDRDVHEAEINTGFANGLLAGVQRPSLFEDGSVVSRGRFDPGSAVRRDQMATFLGRLLGRALMYVPGGTYDPYLRQTPVPLTDGFTLTVLGSDQDATQEVQAFDPTNGPPAGDANRYTIYRVRVVNDSATTATFATDQRLVAQNVGVTPRGPTFSAAGSPCGLIPDPLGEPKLAPGAAAEGNVCFAVRAFTWASTNLVDVQLGRPTNPSLTGFDQRMPLGGSEATPYPPSPSVQVPAGR